MRRFSQLLFMASSLSIFGACAGGTPPGGGPPLASQFSVSGPTSSGAGLAFTFNAPRFIAFLGPLFAGLLIVQFGGFSHAAITIACIYVLGFCVTPFLPETNGKPLPA